MSISSNFAASRRHATYKRRKHTLYLAANSEAGIPDGNFWSNLKMFLFTKPGTIFPAEIYSDCKVPPETVDMQSNCLAGGSLAAPKELSSVLTSLPTLLVTPKSEILWGSGEKFKLHGAAYDKLPSIDSLGGDGFWSCSGTCPTFLDAEGPAPLSSSTAETLTPWALALFSDS